jgi:DmsE family decaheme c-type cytochrome
VEKKKGWEMRACESCHGAALKHTETADAAEIRNPAKLSPAAADKVCLTCHLNQPTHVGRIESSHAKDQVSCTSCHSVHGSAGAHGMVARAPADVNKQCSSCHVAEWAQFQKAFHHRVPENAMSCVDCHNPHGTTRRGSTRTFAANEPACINCH